MWLLSIGSDDTVQGPALHASIQDAECHILGDKEHEALDDDVGNGQISNRRLP